MAMTLVSTVTVGSGGAASIEFTNIPQTGKDLLVLLSGRTAQADIQWAIDLSLNNSSASIYSERMLYGSGSSAVSTSRTNQTSFAYFYTQGTDTTTNTFNNSSFYLSNYASAANKSASSESVVENNATGSWQAIVAHTWASTAAVTSLKLTPSSSGTFAQHSTASLYIIS